MASKDCCPEYPRTNFGIFTVQAFPSLISYDNSIAFEEGINEEIHDDTTPLPSIENFNGTFWLYLEYGLQGVRADWGATAVKTPNEESRDGYCGKG